MIYRSGYMIERYSSTMLLVMTVLISCMYSPLAAEGKASAGYSWPFEQSDLTPDPSILRGVLGNGLRYVIKKNAEPAERVAMYLNIQSGSLHESNEQRGVAHFLEHLMFNGSSHFPPGSLIDYFQESGMNFGSDTNAHTSYDETVYRIFLPNGSPAQVDKMLLVMADYAGGALLLDSEIDRERGVIFAEKRSRDSASYRAHLASSSYAFRGTMYPDRMVIGTQEVLEKADSALLRSYYNTWYRPDNMIVVIVGVIEPAEIEKLVENQFSELTADGPLPEQPDFKALDSRGLESFYHYEPDLGRTTVSIETFWDAPLVPDSKELEQLELTRLLGTMIMRYRLQRLLEEETLPFSAASYNDGDIINRIDYRSISAQTNSQGWKESLKNIDQVLRQSLEFGFQDNEFERAKSQIISLLDSSVLTARTEDSRTIGRQIIDHLNSNRVYQSSQQQQELYTNMINSLTVDDVNYAFQQGWKNENRLISVIGDTILNGAGKREIKELYKIFQREEVTVGSGLEIQQFPYLEIEKSTNRAMQVERFQEIDAEKVTFANGLVVNLKTTSFKDQSFQFTAGFGNGGMTEVVPGMALLAEKIVNGSGSNRLSLTDIEVIMAGNSVDMHFRMGDSVNYWVGGGLSQDFEVFVQLLHTMLFDGGFRENIFDKVLAKTELMYQKMHRDIRGAFPLSVQPFLAGYNPRFGMPGWDEISKITFEDLADWAGPALEVTDLEISIVGDFEKEKVVQQIEKYFGAAHLAGINRPDIPIIEFPAGRSLTVPVNTSIAKAMVLLVWSTDDFWDIARTRRLNLLADIFADRVRKVIREKQGASYSPNVSNFNSKVFKGYGYILAHLTVEPGSEDGIVREIEKISLDLMENGVTEDELERAANPAIASLRDRIKTNGYWLKSVLFNSSRHPQQLEWPLTLIEDYSAITVNELNALAKKYFKLDKTAAIKVVPATRSLSENASAESLKLAYLSPTLRYFHKNNARR